MAKSEETPKLQEVETRETTETTESKPEEKGKVVSPRGVDRHGRTEKQVSKEIGGYAKPKPDEDEKKTEPS